MRLIDADELRERYSGDEFYSAAHIREAIDKTPTASPWHRVEDELPKYGQDVLAARIYGADSDGWAYEIIIAHTCSAGDSTYWNATNITHWMPFPEPPKIEGDA